MFSLKDTPPLLGVSKMPTIMVYQFKSVLISD